MIFLIYETIKVLFPKEFDIDMPTRTIRMWYATNQRWTGTSIINNLIRYKMYDGTTIYQQKAEDNDTAFPLWTFE